MSIVDEILDRREVHELIMEIVMNLQPGNFTEKNICKKWMK